VVCPNMAVLPVSEAYWPILRDPLIVIFPPAVAAPLFEELLPSPLLAGGGGGGTQPGSAAAAAPTTSTNAILRSTIISPQSAPEIGREAGSPSREYALAPSRSSRRS